MGSFNASDLLKPTSLSNSVPGIPALVTAYGPSLYLSCLSVTPMWGKHRNGRRLIRIETAAISDRRHRLLGKVPLSLPSAQAALRSKHVCAFPGSIGWIALMMVPRGRFF